MGKFWLKLNFTQKHSKNIAFRTIHNLSVLMILLQLMSLIGLPSKEVLHCSVVSLSHEKLVNYFNLEKTVASVPLNKLSLSKCTAAKYGSGYESKALITSTRLTTTWRIHEESFVAICHSTLEINYWGIGCKKLRSKRIMYELQSLIVLSKAVPQISEVLMSSLFWWILTLNVWLGSEFEISFWVSSPNVRKPRSPKNALKIAAEICDQQSIHLNWLGS